MAKLKVILDKNESIEEADDLLFKAIDFHVSGQAHVDEEFDDAAMADAYDLMKKLHKDIYDDMMDEILMIIDSEY